MKSLFSFSGYVSRTRYWVTSLLAIPTMVLVMVIGASIVPGFGLKFLFAMACVFLYLWIQLSVVIRRCRDCGLHPIWTVALFMPFINVITFIVIGVLPQERYSSY